MIDIFLILLSISAMIFCMYNYIKLFYYLKKKKPMIFNHLYNPQSLLPMFEWQRFSGMEFWSYVTSTHSQDDATTKKYKTCFIYSLLIAVVSFFVVFLLF